MGGKRRAAKWLEGQDLFGKPVELTFDGKAKHTTLFGGLFSILVKLAMAVYLSILVKRLVLYEGDQNSMQVLRTEFDELGSISLADSFLQLYGALYDRRDYSTIPYNNETRRFIEVSYHAVSQNLFADPIQMNRTAEEAVLCSEAEDIHSEFEKFITQHGNSQKVFCPRTSRDKILENTFTSGMSKLVQLVVSPCQPKPDDPDFECAAEEEIDAFIENLVVYSLSHQDQVDFMVHDRKPVYQTARPIMGAQMKKGVFQYQITQVVLNRVETHDSMIQLGFPSDTFDYYEIGNHLSYEAAPSDISPGALLIETFTLSDQIKKHERRIYGFLELLGDLGGVIEVLVGVLGIFVMPFQDLTFSMKAIQKLYVAKTDDPTLFRRSPLQPSLTVRQRGDLKSPGGKPEAKPGVYQIGLPKNIRSRFILRHFCLTSWCYRSNQNPGLVVTKDDKYSMLLSKGKEKLNQDLKVEELIKSLHNLKLMQKALDEKYTRQASLEPKSIIDLDNLNDYLFAKGTESEISSSQELPPLSFSSISGTKSTGNNILERVPAALTRRGSKGVPAASAAKAADPGRIKHKDSANLYRAGNILSARAAPPQKPSRYINMASLSPNFIESMQKQGTHTASKKSPPKQKPLFSAWDSFVEKDSVVVSQIDSELLKTIKPSAKRKLNGKPSPSQKSNFQQGEKKPKLSISIVESDPEFQQF